MQSENFFPGADRRITLGSPTLLIAKGGARRLRLPIKMPLTGEPMLGMPDWLGDAYTAVAQSFTEVEPTCQQISDISLNFCNSAPSDGLFEHPSAKIPSAELRKLFVLRVGDADDPEVELHLTIYAPFSRDFWKWLGEMAGSQVHLQFPATRNGISVAAPKAAESKTAPIPFLAERPELDPKNDAEFGMGEADMPPGETFGDTFGLEAASTAPSKLYKGPNKPAKAVAKPPLKGARAKTTTAATRTSMKVN